MILVGIEDSLMISEFHIKQVLLVIVHYGSLIALLNVRSHVGQTTGLLTETRHVGIWCNFDRAFSLICGKKMPTRCNRGFYCRSYCLLNMFRTPLCPSSGAREYYTVAAACGISCCGFQVAGLVWSWGLCVRFAGFCSILQTGHITLSWLA